jgi:hypothetical protein
MRRRILCGAVAACAIATSAGVASAQFHGVAFEWMADTPGVLEGQHPRVDTAVAASASRVLVATNQPGAAQRQRRLAARGQQPEPTRHAELHRPRRDG